MMQLAVVGLSHKTAPVEIRERLAFHNEAIRTALTSLVENQEVSEAMILSTCNRVEVVAEVRTIGQSAIFSATITASRMKPSPDIFTPLRTPTRSGTFSG